MMIQDLREQLKAYWAHILTNQDLLVAASSMDWDLDTELGEHDREWVGFIELITHEIDEGTRDELDARQLIAHTLSQAKNLPAWLDPGSSYCHGTSRGSSSYFPVKIIANNGESTSHVRVPSSWVGGVSMATDLGDAAPAASDRKSPLTVSW